MKHVGKVLIIAGSLSLCGIVFLGLGTSMLYKERRSSINQNDTEYEEKQYSTPVSGITEIQTDIAFDHIYFEPGEGDQIEITYRDRRNDSRYQITENNGTLRIYQKPLTGFHLFNIPDLSRIWEEQETVSMTIKVPEAYAGSYDLEVSSGTISLEELEIREKLAVYATSGTIKLDDLTCEKDVEVEVTSGNITIEGIEVQDDLTCRFTSGHSSVKDVTVGGDWKIGVSSGSIDITTAAVDGTLECDFTSGKIISRDVSASEVITTVSSGTISFDDLTVEKGIELSATSGTIRVSLEDAEDNYRINSDVTSGRCNLPENFGNGEKYIDVEVTSGNVDFTFGQ